ncbi:MAG: hypothetical protein PHY47_01040 [Lachnospiraceae bacterium]|nr:hypothetical protein [Lachnospiraceae bacterium]
MKTCPKCKIRWPHTLHCTACGADITKVKTEQEKLKIATDALEQFWIELNCTGLSSVEYGSERSYLRDKTKEALEAIGIL